MTFRTQALLDTAGRMHRELTETATASKRLGRRTQSSTPHPKAICNYYLLGKAESNFSNGVFLSVSPTRAGRMLRVIGQYTRGMFLWQRVFFFLAIFILLLICLLILIPMVFEIRRFWFWRGRGDMKMCGWEGGEDLGGAGWEETNYQIYIEMYIWYLLYYMYRIYKHKNKHAKIYSMKTFFLSVWPSVSPVLNFLPLCAFPLSAIHTDWSVCDLSVVRI